MSFVSVLCAASLGAPDCVLDQEPRESVPLAQADIAEDGRVYFWILVA
jgi:hypothetical protein